MPSLYGTCSRNDESLVVKVELPLPSPGAESTAGLEEPLPSSGAESTAGQEETDLESLENKKEEELKDAIELLPPRWDISIFLSLLLFIDEGSVAGPNWFQIWIRIRIQHFLSMRIRIQTRSRSRVLMTKNWIAEKKIFVWSKIAIYISLGLHEGRPRLPGYRISLHPSKENI